MNYLRAFFLSKLAEILDVPASSQITSHFPFLQQQQIWKYKHGNGKLSLKNGENVYTFSFPDKLYPDVEETNHSFPITRLASNDHENIEGEEHTAQIHRAHPGEIYITLHEGKRNPTYTLKHEGEDRWKAILKKKVAKKIKDLSMPPQEVLKTSWIQDRIDWNHKYAMNLGGLGGNALGGKTDAGVKANPANAGNGSNFNATSSNSNKMMTPSAYQASQNVSSGLAANKMENSEKDIIGNKNWDPAHMYLGSGGTVPNPLKLSVPNIASNPVPSSAGNTSTPKTTNVTSSSPPSPTSKPTVNSGPPGISVGGMNLGQPEGNVSVGGMSLGAPGQSPPLNISSINTDTGNSSASGYRGSPGRPVFAPNQFARSEHGAHYPTSPQPNLTVPQIPTLSIPNTDNVGTINIGSPSVPGTASMSSPAANTTDFNVQQPDGAAATRG